MTFRVGGPRPCLWMPPPSGLADLKHGCAIECRRAFGVRDIPALSMTLDRPRARECRALQTLREVRLRSDHLFVASERIELREYADEAVALAREAELLRSLRPRFNRAGTWPGTLWFLRWRVSKGGLELGVRPAVDLHLQDEGRRAVDPLLRSERGGGI